MDTMTEGRPHTDGWEVAGAVPREIDRRGLVRLLVGAGSVVLAGCVDGDGTTGGESGGSTSGGGETTQPGDDGGGQPPNGGDGETPPPEEEEPKNPNPDAGGGGNFLEFPFGRDFTSEEPFAEEFEAFARFEQPRLGYTLSYPEAWRVTEPADLPGTVLIEEPTAGNGFVYVAPLESAGGLDALADRVFSTRGERDVWSNVEILDERRVTTQGEQELLVLDLQYGVRGTAVREKLGLASATFDYTVSVFANAERYTRAFAGMASEVVESFGLQQ